MSLTNCIPGLIEQGKLTKKQGEKAKTAYERHYRRLSASMGPVQAAAEASEAALKELEYEAKLAKRQTVLQIKTQRNIKAEIEAGDRYRTPVTIVERVEYQRRAILGRAHALMEGILSRHSRDLLGRARDKTGLDDLGGEAFGEKTGNASAAELAGAWKDTTEMLRQRFNRAGGNIAMRADWGLPQVHDSMKVRARPYEEWRADILNEIDLDRMTDNTTGLPFTPEGLEAALKDANETIRTDGWNKRSEGGIGMAKLANRRADARFFAFKDFASWKRYQEKYGTGNVFDAMMGHIDGLAKDIAQMEVLGPNPSATARWLADGVTKTGAVDPDRTVAGVDRARMARYKVEKLFDVVSGGLNSPVNQTWARRMGGVRSVLTSALLGSASISAISDLSFQRATRGFNGLPVTGLLRGYLKLLNPLNVGDRKIAIRLKLQAEEASRMAASLNRYVDGNHAPEVAARMSDFVLRVSGLSPWTQAGRWDFGMSTLGALADRRDRAFNALEPEIKRMFTRYGIDAADWDKIRAAETLQERGGEWIDPGNVEDEKAGDKLLRAILQETDYAVPSVTPRAKAVTMFGAQPGTWPGEIARNTLLFKNFGVTMLLTHGARMLDDSAPRWSRLKYAAGLGITTTLLGALSQQLSAIVKGEDVEDAHPLRNPWFWPRAMLRGGGWGIFGDFLGSTLGQTRFGGGPAETAAGPVVGLVADIGRSTTKLALDSADPNKQANPGKEAVKLAGRYVPGSSIWYLRLAYQREMLDQLQAAIDPDYYTSWARMEQRAAEQGQGYWWHPGDRAPERAPTVAEKPPG